MFYSIYISAINSIDRPKAKPTKAGKTPGTKTATKPEVAQAVQMKTEIRAEIKTEVDKPDYPNYMESIESVINASKEVMKPKTKPYTQAAASNKFPYHHDHQYSRIIFYGSGETNATETKAQETAIKEEKTSIQPKVSARKRSNGKVRTVKKPRQQSHQVVRPWAMAKPIIYRFKPNNGLQQPTPAYFVPSIESASSTTPTVSQCTPAIIRSIHKPIPSIYANATIPFHFNTPVTFVQGAMIQQPIYYLQLCNPKE